MEQCWENKFEIDISDYIRTVCGHMKHNETVDVQVLNQPTPCTDLSPLHRLVKENFLRVVTDRFSPVPTNKRFYYYSKKGTDCDDKSADINAEEGDNDDERRSTVTSNSTNTLASEELLSASPATLNLAKVTSTIASTAATAGILASDSSDNMLDIALELSTADANIPNIGEASAALEGATETLHRIFGGLNDNENFLANISPLFLHFACSLRYENIHCSKPVKLIPTCLGEVAQAITGLLSNIDKSKLRVSLDVICLTLPLDVQNVINDYSTKGMRSTSFCSDGFVPSTRSSASDTSFTSDFKEPDVQFQIPETQRHAINILKSEIKWLLRNESITSMLDACHEPIDKDTLDIVMLHVEDSCDVLQPVRPCCSLEVVELSFVCSRLESHARFVDEFPHLTNSLPEYKLCKQGDFYYLAKNQLPGENPPLMNTTSIGETEGNITPNQSHYHKHNAHDDAQSDVSSLGDASVLSTSTGYDEDVSADEEDFDWLVELSNKRSHLPNFWLIMQVTSDAVRIYFHCRFVELSTNHAVVYKSIRQDIVKAIRDLCKRVNQTMLLQQLYETRICSNLLEPEESFNEFGKRSSSFTRLRATQENVQNVRRSPKTRQKSSRNKFKSEKEDKKLGAKHPSMFTKTNLRRDVIYDAENSSDEEMHYEPGHFKCPVIWEHPFSLHPRLKTGVGKSSLNVGFNAMTSVLEKFNVADRRNMFVIQSKSGCVFYLYLYEHIQFQTPDRRQFASDVSRSPSVASLPTGQQRDLINITPIGNNEIRPRVRSFGDRESSTINTSEDCIILKVRGIPPICDEISVDLVGVLQNRLDDTVLEFLSVTLARNWRCPLTPEDVAFLKKPSRLPDKYITMNLNGHVVHFIDAFYYYLKENLLQWMNVPNYTDSKYGQYHFRDNAAANLDTTEYHEESIFLFNQNQNPSSGQPSSGHHAIAVVSFCVIDKRSQSTSTDDILGPEPIPSITELTKLLSHGPMSDFAIAQLISNSDTEDTEEFNACASGMYVQFRVWRNGRLNWDLLSDILLRAVNQTQWDLITEYYMLRVPFTTQGKIDGVSSLQSDLNQMKIIRDDNLIGDETEDNLVAVEGDVKSVFVAVELPETCPLPRSMVNDTKVKLSQPKRRHFYARMQYIVKPSSKNALYVAKPPPEVGPKTPVLKAISISANESGLSGILNSQYCYGLGEWLAIGEHLCSPNVRKFNVHLKPQDNLDIIAREVSSQMSIISQDTVRAFYYVSKKVGSAVQNYYIPFDYTVPPEHSPLSSHYPSRKDMPVILFARNNQYWKLQMNALGSSQYPDGINCNFLQHSQYQRTLPALVQNRTFVPRQKMAMAVITLKDIVFLTYNWNKDNAERLSDLQQAQSLWLNARSVALSSGIQAKLGHFHNLPHQRQTVHTVQNPYMQYMQEPEVVATFQPDKIRKSQLLSAVAASAALASSTPTTTPSPIMLQDRSTERSSLVSRQRHSSVTSSTSGTTSTIGQAAAITPASNVSAEMVHVFRNRHVDYCPADTTDTDATLAMCREMQSLNDSDVFLTEIRTLQNLYIGGEKIRNLDCISLIHKFGRIIHYCHTPMLFLSKWRIATAATRDQSLIPREISNLNFDDFEEWHNDLCVAFVTECTKYIKKLGFQECPIKPDRQLLSEWRETGTIKVFLQKNIMGGLMIYIIAMVEPFVTTKLMVVECDRFLDKPVKKNQFSLTFLDECDRIRDTMHLHSFTYDFHLRAVSNYLSGVAGIKLFSGFHLTRFLDDFIRYYTKSPNYARNLVYAGEMEVSDLVTDGRHLYNYLLSHNRDYGFETVTMRERHDLDADYVLVQTVRVPHIVYTDSADRQHTDNFDLTLIASFVPPHMDDQSDTYHQRETRSSPGHCYHTGWDRSEGRFIKLRYYIVLTTRGDIYPKATAERKLGKFRTVSINAKRNKNEFGDTDVDIETQASTSADNTLSSTLMPSDDELTITDKFPTEEWGDFTNSPVSQRATSSAHYKPKLRPINLFTKVPFDSTTSSESSDETQPFTKRRKPQQNMNTSTDSEELNGQIVAAPDATKSTYDPTLELLFLVPKINIASTSFSATLADTMSPSESIEAELNVLESTVKADTEAFQSVWEQKTQAIPCFAMNECDVLIDKAEATTTVSQSKFDLSPKLMSASLNPNLRVIRKKSLNIDDVKVPDIVSGSSLSVPTVSGFHIKRKADTLDKSFDNGFDKVKIASSPRSPTSTITGASTSGAVAGAASAISQKPEIRQEKVNYLGYFSTHEQLMQNVMNECGRTCEQKLREMVQQGTVDCRTHYLWDKLMTVCCDLTFAEFAELKAQAHLVHISQAAVEAYAHTEHADRVTTMLAQPAAWHERFAKAIAAKYTAEHRRHFASDDATVQYFVALHHRYDRACVLMAVDFHANHGDVYAMERVMSSPESEMDKQDRHDFLYDFIHKFCYQIWKEMVDNN